MLFLYRVHVSILKIKGHKICLLSFCLHVWLLLKLTSFSSSSFSSSSSSCSFQHTPSLGSKGSGESIASERSDDYRTTDTEILVDIDREFKFPIQLEMKKWAESGQYPEENCLRRLIRDACVCACLQAIADEEITTDQMILPAKKIARVFQFFISINKYIPVLGKLFFLVRVGTQLSLYLFNSTTGRKGRADHLSVVAHYQE